MIQNDLLLRAMRGEPLERPPVWMMRQAGRYLPEYMELRQKYDFFTRVQTPELACEITLQPMEIVKPDAAIIFSDILTVPQAMGLEVQLIENKGPVLPKTVRSPQEVEQLVVQEAADRLQYVYDAIRLTKRAIDNAYPLIGFGGAPFTLLCYMVQGQGSKTFDKARQFCFTQPEAAKLMLQKITDVTIAYLKRQQDAGVDVIQLFDSWSGLLSPADFNEFCMPYVRQIAAQIGMRTPFTYFAKNSWYAIPQLELPGITCIGLDWCISPQHARQWAGDQLCLQGNFDPQKLMLPPAEIQRLTHEMIDAFGTTRYIANLGHGITPHVPVDHARAFVDAVKSYTN